MGPQGLIEREWWQGIRFRILCTYVHIYIHVYICVYVLYIYIHTYEPIVPYEMVSICMHTCIYIYTSVYICTYINAFLHIHMYACMHICICIHTNRLCLFTRSYAHGIICILFFYFFICICIYIYIMGTAALYRVCSTGLRET